ncbi:hypothetical protein ACWA7J_17360 [Leptothrix sp. BB-4]
MSTKHLAAATLFAAISATALLAMASAPAEAALPFSHPATQPRDQQKKTPAGIDANTFIVQPPASVVWTDAPVEPISTAAAR